MEQDDPSFYLAPISHDDARDFIFAPLNGPSVEEMQFWDRPPTPFRYPPPYLRPFPTEEDLTAESEHIDAIFNNVPRPRLIAPTPRKYLDLLQAFDFL